jgi:hypothetical protein
MIIRAELERSGEVLGCGAAVVMEPVMTSPKNE